MLTLTRSTVENYEFCEKDPRLTRLMIAFGRCQLIMMRVHAEHQHALSDRSNEEVGGIILTRLLSNAPMEGHVTNRTLHSRCHGRVACKETQGCRRRRCTANNTGASSGNRDPPRKSAAGLAPPKSARLVSIVSLVKVWQRCRPRACLRRLRPTATVPFGSQGKGNNRVCALCRRSAW